MSVISGATAANGGRGGSGCATSPFTIVVHRGPLLDCHQTLPTNSTSVDPFYGFRKLPQMGTCGNIDIQRFFYLFAMISFWDSMDLATSEDLL